MENLSVAFGSTKLSNEMSSYTTDQEMFVTKTFYTSGGFCVAVERQHRREFSVHFEPSKDKYLPDY
jgi:hypothetical protein